jgi:hypothetical protein
MDQNSTEHLGKVASSLLGFRCRPQHGRPDNYFNGFIQSLHISTGLLADIITTVFF